MIYGFPFLMFLIIDTYERIWLLKRARITLCTPYTIDREIGLTLYLGPHKVIERVECWLGGFHIHCSEPLAADLAGPLGCPGLSRGARKMP